MKSIIRFHTKLSLLFIIALTYNLVLSGQEEGLNSIELSDLQGHLYFLSSDELDGRATADSSIHTAARYIASELKKMGLTAVDENRDY